MTEPRVVWAKPADVAAVARAERMARIGVLVPDRRGVGLWLDALAAAEGTSVRRMHGEVVFGTGSEVWLFTVESPDLIRGHRFTHVFKDLWGGERSRFHWRTLSFHADFDKEQAAEEQMLLALRV